MIFLRIGRLFLLILLCSVLCFGLFTFSTYAATIEQYSYNGIVLPSVYDVGYNRDDYRELIGVIGETYYLYIQEGSGMRSVLDDGTLCITHNPSSGSSVYVSDGSEWVLYGQTGVDIFVSPIWSDGTVWYSTSSGAALSGSEVVVTFVEVPDPPPPPPSMKDILSFIGDLFTAAISWVGNVGSTILQQPLLLAFCALPLCGIGIGFFKRLKTAS